MWPAQWNSSWRVIIKLQSRIISRPVPRNPPKGRRTPPHPPTFRSLCWDLGWIKWSVTESILCPPNKDGSGCLWPRNGGFTGSSESYPNLQITNKVAQFSPSKAICIVVSNKGSGQSMQNSPTQLGLPAAWDQWARQEGQRPFTVSAVARGNMCFPGPHGQVGGHMEGLSYWLS